MQDGSDLATQGFLPQYIGLVPETVKAIQSIKLELDGDDGEETEETEDSGEETSEDSENGTPAKERTYTEEEYKKVSNDLSSESGRRKAAETRATKYKKELDQLHKDYEDEVSGKADKENPDSFTNAQFRIENRRLKSQVAQLEADLEEAQENNKEIDRLKELESARKIASGYTNIDAEDLVGKNEEEQLAFCKKYGKPKGKSEKSEESDHKPDSGVTSKRGVDTSTLSPREKISAGLNKASKKK